jgi:hypothetical protein
MSTEFSRLYRELCHSGPNDPIKDIHFNRERKQVFKALGYQIKSEPERYQVSKHHGKAPRRRLLEARLKAISSEVTGDRKRQLEMRELSRKTLEVNELTNKIQTLLADNKYVGKNIWSKYDKIYGYDTSSEISPSKTLPPKPSRAKGSVTETQTRSRSVIRCDYSKAKWTKEERDRLNYLYLELTRPPSHSLEAWDVYFAEFASQFRVFHSQRSEGEAIEKIKEMFATRQFTESGEGLYWTNVRATSPVALRKQRDRALLPQLAPLPRGAASNGR